MKCAGCGRMLRSKSSIDTGYGPVCYQKVYGKPVRIRRSKSISSDDDFPYYDIPGQITMDEYLESIK